MTPLSILILDDEDRLARELAEFLENDKHHVLIADRPSVAFTALKANTVDIALVDIKLPEYNGLEFISNLKNSYPLVETIVMSGHGDMDSVIEAFRLGAFDYLRKPFATLELQAALSRTTRYLAAKNDSRHFAMLCAELNRELAGRGQMIGNSPAMNQVRATIKLAAESAGTSVLVQGESGTGKELVARSIHSMSARASGRFVAINCAAVPSEMFESEFFGHVQGAFTDARSSRTGLFRSASGGTLFLDEISEIPYHLQAKLLRAIEEKSVRPVGSDYPETIDIRIICATNMDLKDAVNIGKFRQDLYFRLAVMEIQLPPLRERPDDIPLLASHFLQVSALNPRTARQILDSNFLTQLSDYSFPGNIRELKNLVERSVILKRPPRPQELQAWLGTCPSVTSSQDKSIKQGFHSSLNLEDLEKQTILLALDRTQWVYSAAAKMLGITRQTLDRRMQRYGIVPVPEISSFNPRQD